MMKGNGKVIFVLGTISLESIIFGEEILKIDQLM